MKTIYQFEDWTSASKMKNEINPCLRIDIGVVRNKPCTRISGYQLTVYCERDNMIIYRFFIDNGEEGTWSLSTEEAIAFLNQIGFPCEFIREHYEISDEVRTILNAALDLGYTHVQRNIRPAEILVLKPDTAEYIIAHPDEVHRGYPCLNLRAITEYNYQDFCFLQTTVPVKIEGILA